MSWRIESKVIRPSGHIGFCKVYHFDKLVATFKEEEVAKKFVEMMEKV